jgi:ABC-type branched-subunit amino acid transport system substrate-binding protein
MARSNYFFILMLLLMGAFTIAQTRQTHNLDEMEHVGKRIFTKGIGSGTKITASMSGVDVPGSVMTCVNCHNANGKGNAEGGITPSDITWFELTKSYGGKRKSGKKYPPYNEKTLKKAITMGIDPGGNELNSAMPRYNMSLNDLNCLVAYLKTLGTKGRHDVAATETKINIGVALPGIKNVNPDYVETIKKTINAYCGHLNKEGGIYGRKLSADFFYLSDTGNNKGNNLLNFLNKKKYITLTGFGLQNEALALARYAGIAETPALMTCTQQATPNGFSNPFAFYMYPSILAQAKSLVDFSEQLLTAKEKKAIVIYQNVQTFKPIAELVAEHYASIYGDAPTLLCTDVFKDEKFTTADITENTCIFYIGSQMSVNEVAGKFDKQKKHPYIFAIGNLSACNLLQLPQQFKSRVYIAYNTWLTEITAAGMSQYQSLQQEYKLENKYRNVQLDVIAMIATLEECFKRIGKDLTKEKLQKMLEGLYDYRTGLSPALSYNLNKRVGSTNVYITSFDEENNNIKLVSTLKSSE